MTKKPPTSSWKQSLQMISAEAATHLKAHAEQAYSAGVPLPGAFSVDPKEARRIPRIREAEKLVREAIEAEVPGAVIEEVRFDLAFWTAYKCWGLSVHAQGKLPKAD